MTIASARRVPAEAIVRPSPPIGTSARAGAGVTEVPGWRRDLAGCPSRGTGAPVRAPLRLLQDAWAPGRGGAEDDAGLRLAQRSELGSEGRPHYDAVG
ncbi:hypothetical protein GCM10012287_05050 [Streptomyces daqingensis]|uniref:Uncharacterized protein n=1 Tax=Streptomyces daqingensis TaxID=1472640 RepID=A0ABQ2LTS0_9ACTN|nr:hypothetical protein GCM10012287_05050 [Streptomyces daqingensis]